MSQTTMIDPLAGLVLPPGVSEVRVRVARRDDDDRPAAWQCWVYERGHPVPAAVGIRRTSGAAIRAAFDAYARAPAGRRPPAEDPDIEDMLG
jgi:hypothetical protein